MRRIARPSLRFSLRTGFIILTLFCLLLGNRVAELRREAIAIESLRAAKASITWGTPWNPQWGGDYYFAPKRSRVARILLGSQPEDRVCHVRFPNQWKVAEKKCDDTSLQTWLPHLEALGGIREIEVEGTRITSDGVSQLTRFKTLEVLKLCNVAVDDSAVDALTKLRRLKFLDILHTRISIEGARRIQTALPNCRIRGPEKSVGYFADHYGEIGDSS